MNTVTNTATNIATTVGQIAGMMPAGATEEKKGWLGAIGGKVGTVAQQGMNLFKGAGNVYTGFKEGNMTIATAGATQILLVVANVAVGVANPGAGVAMAGVVTANAGTIGKVVAGFFNGLHGGVKADLDAVAEIMVKA